MSTDLAETPTKRSVNGTKPEPATHALHIKDLPHDVWCRARHNANLSGMPYRDYIIRVLAESQPFARESDAAVSS